MTTHDASENSTIKIVVVTVCILAGICVCAEAACSIFKIPDMSGNLSGGFVHVTDTLVGALIALLINTRSAQPRGITDSTVTVTQTGVDPPPPLP